jgi:hypothetical protein
VIIVNYKVPDYAVQALRSLQEAQLHELTETIVVDNASQDDSRSVVLDQFPSVCWIGLKNNIGYGKACNVGAQNARGEFLLFLNPDTVISHNTLSACVEFLRSRPDVGIVGPKILNPNGRLQASCRRSFPTPFNAFCHLFGLSALVPKSRLFGRYNLTYLDADTASEVDAVSGSFMFMHASIFRAVRGFDEAFFMYGEDLDLCARVRRHGFKVWYLPSTQIVHFKGRSSSKRAIRSQAAFYEAMILFSRKYRGSYGSFFPRWLVYVGIMLQAGLKIGATLVTNLTACFIDLLIVNVVLWTGITIRFSMAPIEDPYHAGLLLPMLGMHALMSASFLLTYAVQGVYSTVRYSPGHALVSGLIASTVFVASIYFTRAMAFSRIAFAFSAFVASFALVGWREMLPLFQSRVRRLIFATGTVIVIGDGDAAKALIRKTEDDCTARIAGVVWPRDGNNPGQFEGYAVLGTINNLRHVLQTQHANLLLVATSEPWYSYFIEALGSLRLRHLKVKWVKPDVLAQKAEDLPDEIELQDFNV